MSQDGKAKYVYSFFDLLYSRISDAVALLVSLLFIGLVLFGMGSYVASEALGYAALILFIYISLALVFHLMVRDGFEPLKRKIGNIKEGK